MPNSFGENNREREEKLRIIISPSFSRKVSGIDVHVGRERGGMRTRKEYFSLRERKRGPRNSPGVLWQAQKDVLIEGWVCPLFREQYLQLSVPG